MDSLAGANSWLVFLGSFRFSFPATLAPIASDASCSTRVGGEHSAELCESGGRARLHGSAARHGGSLGFRENRFRR